MMLDHFLGGAISMGFAVAALLFLKFWTRTRDRLFLAFAAAFLLLGINQALLSLATIAAEERTYLYLFRLCAFLIIIVAFLAKNRKAPRGKG